MARRLAEGLDSEQTTALFHSAHVPLLVIGGAGTGKTEILARRIAYLVLSGIAPGDIVALTMMQSAAWKLRRRVEHFLGAMCDVRFTTWNFIGDRPKFLLVDGYEEATLLQQKFVRGEGAFAVADPGQSVYGWRHARPEIIRDWPDAKVVRLRTNYRSDLSIVKAARVLTEPLMISSRSLNEPIRVVEAENAAAEASYIVGEIFANLRAGVVLREIVVLARFRSMFEAVEKALAAARLPFVSARKADAPSAAFLSLIEYVCLEKSPRPMLGRQEVLDHLLQDCTRNFSPDRARAFLEKERTGPIEGLFERTVRFVEILGVEMKEDMARFKDIRGRTRPHSVEEMLLVVEACRTSINQRSDVDEDDAVRLMTIHSSKGFEWDVVFVAGAEEGAIPARDASEAEEKRLFHVAITRAKRRLFITHVRERDARKTAASSLLKLLPRDCTEKIRL